MGEISYSAGSSSLDPYAFRFIKSAEDKIFTIISAFPQISSFFEKKILVINCYPASLGDFSNTLYVNTYLKKENFIRAFSLAEKEGLGVLIQGQPLAVFNFILEYQKLGLDFPKHVLIGLGGYFCPASLEDAFKTIFTKRNSNLIVVHAYGVAEVEYACFAGIRNANSQIIYKQVSKNIDSKIDRDGFLLLKNKESTGFVETGDRVVIEEHGEDSLFHIKPSNKRMFSGICTILESFSYDHWRDFTGYVAYAESKVYLQLRAGLSNSVFKFTKTTEVENVISLNYFDFCSRFNMTWLDKPNWGNPL